MKPLNVLGLTIFAAGGLALAGFGLYKFSNVFLKDESISLIVKWAIIGLILGTVIILISLIIERIRDQGE